MTIANGILRGTAILALMLGATAAGGGKTYAPKIDPADFQDTVDHPHFPLVPGTSYTYRETEGGRSFIDVVTVTHEKKVIMGVSCVVVRDVVKLGDTVREDTSDWYAQDKRGNVWYFGEDTREFRRNGAADTEGSWEAGVGKNQPGIIMPAAPRPGAPYRQEYGPGHAEDMGQIVALGESVTVPAASYRDCVKTKEWSLLEPGYSNKWYAPGVGLIRELSSSKEELVLLKVEKP